MSNPKSLICSSSPLIFILAPSPLLLLLLPLLSTTISDEATSTLVDAWGRRYLDLNRGNLRQKDWQEVADAVNLRQGHTKKIRRTDVQCKNRIDTLKKKYKVEKARVSESNRSVTRSWSFFPRLDYLIGSTAKKAPSPPLAVPLVYRKPPIITRRFASVSAIDRSLSGIERLGYTMRKFLYQNSISRKRCQMKLLFQWPLRGILQ